MMNLANVRMDQGNYRGALTYLQPALALFQAVEAKGVTGVARMIIGMSHYELGDYALSEAHLHEALTHLRTVAQNIPGYVSCALYCLADVVRARGQIDQAHEYGEEALIQAKVNNEPFYVVIAQFRLGAVEIELGNLVAARQHYEEALVLCDEHELESDKISGLIGLGQITLLEGNPNSAKQSFTNALSVAHRFSSEVEVAICNAWLAEIELGVQNLKAAHSLLHEALEKAAHIESQRVQTYILAVWTCLNELEGHMEESAVLLGLLLHHPATESLTKKRLLMPLHLRLEGRLGTLFHEAMLRGQSQKLDHKLVSALATFVTTS